MTLKYFYDLMSQPSRAVCIFLKINNIPFEPCPVKLRKGEHLQDEFKENCSRFQKVPFIHDGDFRLTENVAIVRYLSSLKRNQVADNWYPKDLKAQAKVDEYLEWQHNNTRAMCAQYFRTAWLMPFITGQPADPKSVERCRGNMEKTLDDIEELWLGQGNEYLAGNKISYADILAACELEQPTVLGYDIISNRKNMAKWFEKVKKDTAPYYEEAHEAIRMMTKKTAELKAKSKL